ncbi:hypothetical protein C8R43DRAFT_1076861 [Mycena crocata]|nr:hypothetical protein C8R43DRAFT_1076861 [Mycena crocata]
MSSTEAELHPRFPVELQREIFELAAHAHLPAIPNLLLVAHRVKTWFVQLWMHFLTFKNVQQLLNSRPASFFLDHVRNLCIDTSNRLEGEAILTKCNRAHNIYIRGPADCTFLPLLATMAPRRLRVELLRSFFRPADVDYSHPLFARVTHLEVAVSDLPPQGANLAALTCLTHLAIHRRTSNYAPIEGALTHCPHLEVLVVLSYEEVLVDWDLFRHFAHEIRLVQLVLDDVIGDWKSGAVDGKDFWTKADAVVRERQSHQSTGRFDLQCNRGDCSCSSLCRLDNRRCS